jgi:predicted enzyme involved in methoxymalonyl-ACP biosynthesis
MRYEADTLDYLALLKEARSPAAAECAKTIKLALLADFATQHLTPILKVLFARNGVKLDVYEAGYDSIDTEILDPGSGLHAFAPRYVVILVATEKLKARLYPIENRGNFAEEAAARFTTLWEALKRSGSATVIQGNYVTPSERAFGNFELKAVDSVGSIVADINHRLAAAAREANNVLLCDIDPRSPNVWCSISTIRCGAA